MLKLTIDVLSGVSGFVERVSMKPENRDVFLQGILLYLMGERVSLYALDKHVDDPLFAEQSVRLKTFLAQLKLKGCITEKRSSYDVMSFSQHKKDGAPRYANHTLVKGKLVPSSQVSRLNTEYSSYIQAGLFGAFAMPKERLVEAVPLWKESRHSLCKMLTSIISSSDASDGKLLSKKAAQHIVDVASSKLSELQLNEYVKYDIGDAPYSTIMRCFEAATDAKLTFSSKRKNVSERMRDDAEHILICHQLRLLCFVHAYLMMYVQRFVTTVPPSCSKFGQPGLDFKQTQQIVSFIDSCDNLSQPILDKRSSNGETEFYKTFVNCSPYGVATSSPVLHKRYDGQFDLYVQADVATLKLILGRIKQSQRYYLTVGKQCYGKLRRPGGILPSSRFEQAIDDYY